MIKRPALAIAIGLTTFIMTIAGVLFYQLSTIGVATSGAEAVAQPAKTNTSVQPVSAVDMAVPTPKISPEQAATAALKSTPGGRLLRAPELVNYMGITAYEVTLSTGLVYVDINTARVLYNGAVPAQSVAQQRGEKEHKAEHGSIFGTHGDDDGD
ncbi:MAG: PepSY domain-containing protein [Chloroflexi bacterium]|nr:PepSY domain-containing protein [Chloroflexota bacterium]